MELVGKRIKLISMTNEPDPITYGSLGTVTHVSEVDLGGRFTQISVAWDNGRRLMLCVPPDRYEVVG